LKLIVAIIETVGMNVGPDPTEMIPLEKFRRQLEVNLVGPLAVTQVRAHCKLQRVQNLLIATASNLQSVGSTHMLQAPADQYVSMTTY